MMSTRIPPGRAGRMWLRRRLATARRGIDLLRGFALRSQRALKYLLRSPNIALAVEQPGAGQQQPRVFGLVA